MTGCCEVKLRFIRAIGWSVPVATLLGGALLCLPLSDAAGASRLTFSISLGVTDEQSTSWDGELQGAEGMTIESAGVRRFYPANRGGLEVTSDRTVAWEGASRREVVHTYAGEPIRDPEGDPIHYPLQPYAFVVQLSVTRPGAVTVTTDDHGAFEFLPSELEYGQPVGFLGGRARVERVAPTVALDTCESEDGGIRYNDFPAICAGPDGVVWTAYVSYTGRLQPTISLREEPEDFEFLRQAPFNDQLWVVRAEGDVPGEPVAITPPGLDLFRPAIAADAAGRVAIIWSQGGEEGWNLHAAVLRDGAWSAPLRLTSGPYPDINAAAVAAGEDIWVAWQSFGGGVSRIMLGRLNPQGHGLDEVVALTEGVANAWMPAIAADSRGNLAVVYDTYEQGRYDVWAALVSPDGGLRERVPVAASLKYEAKATAAYDARDRLWVAWEQTGENWGKDCSRMPGAPYEGECIEYQRTLRVACLDGERRLTPAMPVEEVIPFSEDISWVFGRPVRPRDRVFGPPRRLAFYPRLAAGADGRIYLAYRRHDPVPDRALVLQTSWSDFVTTYDGETWSEPTLVNGSDGHRHCMPALSALPEGGVAIAVAGDERASERRGDTFRNQNVRLGRFTLPGEAAPLTLVDTGPEEPAPAPPAVVAEREDVRRMRDHRATVGGTEYRILRGDFHRHTAFSGDSAVGDGVIEDAFRYAFDAAALDTISNGDHDNGGAEYPWYVTQKFYDVHHLPDRFASMFGYERSRGENAIGGHRNIIMAERGIRVLPGFGVEKTDETGSVQDTRMLFRFLRQVGAVSIPHTIATGAGPNFVDYAPDVDPVVELYQGARNAYEYPGSPRGIQRGNDAGFLWTLLASGKMYGVIASSDHRSTHISYAMLYVSEMSREGVLDALRRRNTYAATDNILLDVRAGEDAMMGDALEWEGAPTLDITVVGTGPLDTVDIIRNAEYYARFEPEGDSLELTWTDPDPVEGRSNYYVRVLQQDGEIAWGSAIWFRPPGTPLHAVPPTSAYIAPPPEPVTATAPRAAAAITIDGRITPPEWGGADLDQALVMEQNPRGRTLPRRSLAWLAWDDEALYVAMDNAVDPEQPLRMGNAWGEDDAVEVAIRNAAVRGAPILAFRGFPSGHFEVSDEPGTPPEAVARAAEGLQYAAHVVDEGRWTAEWRLPFAAMGIDPDRHRELAFNLTVHRSAGPAWAMWQGTRGRSWEVGRAGVLALR